MRVLERLLTIQKKIIRKQQISSASRDLFHDDMNSLFECAASVRVMAIGRYSISAFYLLSIFLLYTMFVLFDFTLHINAMKTMSISTQTTYTIEVERQVALVLWLEILYISVRNELRVLRKWLTYGMEHNFQYPRWQIKKKRWLCTSNWKIWFWNDGYIDVAPFDLQGKCSVAS